VSSTRATASLSTFYFDVVLGFCFVLWFFDDRVFACLGVVFGCVSFFGGGRLAANVCVAYHCVVSIAPGLRQGKASTLRFRVCAADDSRP